MAEKLKIGDLTQMGGVTQRTIRYYESIGLLPEGEREGNGHFYYPELTLRRLEKIGQLKKLGLSLEEIGQVLELYFTEPGGIEPKQIILTMLRNHLTQTDQKLAELHQFRTELIASIARFEVFLTTYQK